MKHAVAVRGATLLRVVPIVAVAAALAAPAVARAQAPPTGSPAVDRLLRHFRPADFDRDDEGQAAPPVADKLLPRPADTPIVARNPGFSGFTGLTAFDQITADGGNMASLEPPDQGLCAGGGEVIEPINTTFAVFDAAGNRLSGQTALVPFFFPGQHEETFDADGNPVSFGPFISDPKCYFDPDLQRFFMTVLEIDDDPVTGALLNHSSTLLAVSRTSTPSTDRADWFTYAIDTTNDGTNGTPTHPNCPCLGDQPLIGADRFGFYVTTNEFPIDLDNPAFNGAQVYAIDKLAATNGALRVQTIDGAPIPLEEGPAASLQPATSPTAADWVAANGGTEYLLSSLDFDGTIDNRVATWALTNTSSLQSATPAVRLSHVTITSEAYAFPPDADQRKGPTPLRDLLNQAMPGQNFKLLKIAGNDDRMNQVVFAGGHLYGALNTAVKGGRVGLAWFVVDPSLPEGGTLSAAIARQGYVAIRQASALYPSIAVNAAGAGVMTFSVSGKRFFPSAAYTTLDLARGAGPVHIPGPGVEPIDGLFGYVALGGVSRWGDYSAAVPAADGSLWIATEYTPGGPRDPAENWGTFVGRLVP